MKITKNFLKQIIKEEINKLQNEGALSGTGYYEEPDPDRFKSSFDRFLGGSKGSKEEPAQSQQKNAVTDFDSAEEFKEYVNNNLFAISNETFNSLIKMAEKFNLQQWIKQKQTEKQAREDEMYRNFYEGKNHKK